VNDFTVRTVQLISSQAHVNKTTMMTVQLILSQAYANITTMMTVLLHEPSRVGCCGIAQGFVTDPARWSYAVTHVLEHPFSFCKLGLHVNTAVDFADVGLLLFASGLFGPLLCTSSRGHYVGHHQQACRMLRYLSDCCVVICSGQVNSVVSCFSTVGRVSLAMMVALQLGCMRMSSLSVGF
jgi:hypothetical protein